MRGAHPGCSDFVPKPESTVDVLLVDDEPNMLRSITAILDLPEYNLVTAGSGKEALALVPRHDFALILLDVAMPGMSGFETAKLIKQREPSRRIPIIFITGYGHEIDHVFQGYSVGAVDYLQKPVDAHQLESKVAVFVELFRQRKQIERQSASLREAEVREQALLRAQAEAALRDSEALYQYTFEQAPIGIGHATSKGTWTKVNQRLCEIVGGDREQLLHHDLVDIATGQDRARIGQAIAQLESGDAELYAAEHELVPAAGARIWVRLTIRPLRSGDERATRLVVVVDDITESKRLERERARLVEELQRGIVARNDFLTITAHELKTPITPLRLQTASLIRDLQKQANHEVPSNMLRRIEIIDRSVVRIESLIDKLLDLSRLSLGKPALEVEEFDLTTLVKEIGARFSAQARENNSELRLRAEPRLIGRWDRSRIDQVLSNLVSNALKYGNGEPVDVVAERHGGGVRVSVTDRGIGIPTEAQARIFKRFGRLESVQHYGGFGLGLWIAHELAAAHGGRITVCSEPGQGSVFTCELPLDVPEGTRRLEGLGMRRLGADAIGGGARS